MNEKKQYPSVEEMQQIFPDYPCGRRRCSYYEQPDKAQKCCASRCPWFEWWFSDKWQTIRENMGIDTDAK